MTRFIVEERSERDGETIAEHEALEQNGPCEVLAGPLSYCGNFLGLSWVDSHCEARMVCWKHIALSDVLVVREESL